MVHRIENVSFDVARHVQSLNQEERQKLLNALVVAGDDAAREKLLSDSPKTAFLYSAKAVLEKLVGK